MIRHIPSRRELTLTFGNNAARTNSAFSRVTGSVIGTNTQGYYLRSRVFRVVAVTGQINVASNTDQIDLEVRIGGTILTAATLSFLNADGTGILSKEALVNGNWQVGPAVISHRATLVTGSASWSDVIGTVELELLEDLF